MLAKRLHIRLKSWFPFDYSESGEHDLDLYLWIEGRLAHHLNHKGAEHIKPVGGFGTDGTLIFATVTKNRFKVKLVAIERDGPQWLDPDDVAKGEFHIDLDGDPPTSYWTIVAQDPRNTDLKVELKFEIEYLEYVIDNEVQPDPIPEGEVAPIEDTSNYPYPWGNSVMLFQHWLGLGARVRVVLPPDRLVRTMKIRRKNLRTGDISTTVIETYRFARHQIGLADDSISSVYIPSARRTHYTVTLFEDDFSGRKVQLRTTGLHNMQEFGFNDTASSMEVTRSYPESESNPN